MAPSRIAKQKKDGVVKDGEYQELSELIGGYESPSFFYAMTSSKEAGELPNQRTQGNVTF